MKQMLSVILTLSFLVVPNGSFAKSTKADLPDIFSEVSQVIFDGPIDARLGPQASRHCFIAVQSLIDGNVPSAPEMLSEFLEQVCYQGMRSELERQGILGIFASMGIEPKQNHFGNTTKEQALIASEVHPCWNIGILSTAAQNVSLRVSFELNSRRFPVSGSIKLIEAVGGEGDVLQQAFEAARRAIIRCAGNGYTDAISAGQYELNFPRKP